MRKLIKDDIKLMGEGRQITNVIKEKNRDLVRFYYENDFPVALSSFRTYLSKAKIHSDTFKYSISKALDIDYNILVKPKIEQLKSFVNEINSNINLYTTQDDYETIEEVHNLCKKMKLTKESSMMFRAKARNSYFRNKNNHAVEFYEYAISSTSKYEKSRLVFFHSELADLYSRESMQVNADKQFQIALDYINNSNINNEALFIYYYYRGIMYYSVEKYSLAREHFKKASCYAKQNIDKIACVSNIGLTYKKENNFNKALEYYFEALEYYEEDKQLEKGSIYNNISEVYRLQNDFENAVRYINLSLELSQRNSAFYKYLVYIETYTEIQIQIGNFDECTKYLDALLSTRDKQIDKIRILNGINNIIEITENVILLNQLADVVSKLIDSTDNEEYIKDLYECVGKIHIKIKKIGGVL